MHDDEAARLKIPKSQPLCAIMWFLCIFCIHFQTLLCYYDVRDALALNPEQEEACMMMKQLGEKALRSSNHSVQ